MVYEQNGTLPEWLVMGRTVLLPKSNETAQAKNYHPTACQNITYKLFTGIINSFIIDHCTTNNIIMSKQARGKQGSWVCADQLLINKMILDEAKQHRHKLLMMWFDYKKASVGTWAIKLCLNSIETDIMKYQTGLLQGDCIALILFIRSVNPLLFLLSKLPDYKVGPPGKHKNSVSHLFFIDDLKAYAQDIHKANLQLDFIIPFTKDINMQFGSDKCAYIYIERGKQVSLGRKFSINNIELNQLENGDCYKYLGQDEDIRFNNQGTIIFSVLAI